jgi:uncharacterized iron-regulated membrane protein
VLALLAGLPLLVQGVTGAFLSYEREIRNGLGDGRMEETLGRLGIVDLEKRAAAQLGGGEIRWLIWFEDPGEPVWIRWRGADGEEASHLADPGTGNLLAASTAWHRRFEWILSIHRNLGVSRPGQVVMGASALALAAILLSGLVLQVKRSRRLRNFFGIENRKRRRAGPRGWRWWHATLGVWITPLLLLLALTGPVWSFGSYRALIGWLTASEPGYGAVPELAIEADAAVDRAAILAGAEALDPLTGAKRLIFPSGPGQAARFEWAPEDAPYENFRSRAWLHPQTGDLLELRPLSEYTRAESVIRWAYPLHIGKWGGPLTQFLHFLAALSIPFFTATGLWLYWKRTH